MFPEYFRKCLPKLIRKSNFTRLKKICLQARLPQLIKGVTFLEAAGILIRRKKFHTFVDLCRLGLKYGQDYIRSQHLQPGYYDKWLRQEEHLHNSSAPTKVIQFDYNPRISIIISLNQGDLAWLQSCLDSMINQWYPHWELFFIGGSLILEQIAGKIRNLPSEKESRIFLTPNDYSDLNKAFNKALATVGGEFLIFPIARDLLAPSALFEVVKFLNQHPEADIIYADEDAIDSAGKRSDPFFKPDWSPDLALSMPYTGPFTVFRNSRVQALGGFRAKLGQAAQYDLLLRTMEQTTPEKIHHISKILYHRRVKLNKIKPAEEKQLEKKSLQVLSDHLHRISQAGKVIAGPYPGTCRIIRELKDTAGVSIIIPFKDNLPLLSQCLNSIFQKTDYPYFEIILVNNQSREKATYAYLEDLISNPQVRLLHYDNPFNYAAINNRAVEQARYQYIVFLNNDTEVLSPDWLRTMLEHAQRNEVGAVGAKLLYPDLTIQHGGLAVGGGGLLCGDYFRGTPEAAGVGRGLSQLTRNCSAVTGACLMTKKNLFQAAGGFDEVNLPICYNDVDFCLELRRKGYLIVWTPYAILFHHESASRGKNLKTADLERLYREQKFFEEKWWSILEHDPYFNPNLSRIFDGYAY